MTEKIVTHADLPALRRIQEAVGHSGCGPLVDRLIAAAEADRPPLPEGWVLYTDESGTQHVYDNRDGWLFDTRGDGASRLGMVEDVRDRLTPLRPTITEADVEKAARGFYEEGHVIEWSELEDRSQVFYRAGILAAFEAAGIEVQG